MASNNLVARIAKLGYVNEARWIVNLMRSRVEGSKTLIQDDGHSGGSYNYTSRHLDNLLADGSEDHWAATRFHFNYDFYMQTAFMGFNPSPLFAIKALSPLQEQFLRDMQGKYNELGTSAQFEQRRAVVYEILNTLHPTKNPLHVACAIVDGKQVANQRKQTPTSI